MGEPREARARRKDVAHEPRERDRRDDVADAAEPDDRDAPRPRERGGDRRDPGVGRTGPIGANRGSAPPTPPPRNDNDTPT
jgi:hypothetical protein